MTNKKFSLLLLCVILVSCTGTSQIPINTPTRISTISMTAIGTAVHPTLTLTAVPTSTITVAPAPSWTPLPTLVDEDKFLDYISFTKNSICKFPCWAGIYPGKSNWDETLFALHPMESTAKLNAHLGIEGLLGKENVVTWYLSGNGVTVNGDIGAIVDNRNTVNLIHISIEGSSTPSAGNPSHSLPLPQNFNLQSVLHEYGIPSMVFIYTFIHEEQGPLPFSVLLIYPENQFYVIYQREAKLSGNDVAACGPEFSLELGVVDNKDKLVSADSPEMQSIGIKNWKPVEQILSMSPEKFHDIYSAWTTECITFPRNLWSP